MFKGQIAISHHSPRQIPNRNHLSDPPHFSLLQYLPLINALLSVLNFDWVLSWGLWLTPVVICWCAVTVYLVFTWRSFQLSALLEYLGGLVTLQRHNPENSKQTFPEKELRSLSPNSYIHVSVSHLYIPRVGPHTWLQQNRQKDPGNCWNWETEQCNSVLEITRLHSFIFSEYINGNQTIRFDSHQLQCGLPILLQEKYVDRSWEYRTVYEFGWKLGLRLRNSFSGFTEMAFSLQCSWQTKQTKTKNQSCDLLVARLGDEIPDIGDGGEDDALVRLDQHVLLLLTLSQLTTTKTETEFLNF